MKITPYLRSLALRVLPAFLASLAFTAVAKAQDAEPHGGSSPAPVYLSDLTQVYDGNPKSVTVMTDPPNLSVEVTYDGSDTLPTDAGTYHVVATVTDSSYNGQAEDDFVVLKAPQSLNFDPIPPHTYGDPPFQLYAYTDSGLPVTFTVESGPAGIDGDMVTITGTGPVTINAAQDGDSNHEAAESVQQTFDVYAAQTSTSIDSSVNPSDYGQEVTFTAIVVSTQNRSAQKTRLQPHPAAVSGPTGTVRFSIDDQDWGPQTLDGNGYATFATSALSPGLHTVTADYLGDDNYQPSTGYLQDGQQVVANSNADLADLTISDTSLVPNFTPENTSYTASVPNEITTMTVTPTVAYTGYMRPAGRPHGARPRVVVPGGATVTVNGLPVASGSASDPIGLNVGDNVIDVLVTAEDGVTQKNYSVNVTRAGQPEIVVEQPKGTQLEYGNAVVSFDSADIGASVDRVFTIRNIGSADLTGLDITIDGLDPGDFTVTESPTAPVAGPNGFTTFTVRFAPTYSGQKLAWLHIASNDAAQNPFDIQLIGTANDLPTISIDNVVVNEDAGNAVFTVTQSAISPLETTFKYATEDGTAVAPDDYTEMDLVTAAIPAGSTTTTISIPITNDTAHENTETFTVTLSNEQNATIKVATGTATIKDDDAAPIVTNTDDSGAGSLRQAMDDAADGDTITFDFGAANGPQAIGLTSELLITKDVTIDGQNSDPVILSGGGATRIFTISPQKSVTVSNLTLDGGQAATGGGILNAGTLALFNCTMSNNTAATQGGAVQNNGTLQLTNCTLAGNSAGNEGGAILSGPGSTLALGNVTLVHNSAGVSGGGIHSSGTATIANSIVALNTAPTGRNIFSTTGIVTSGGYNLSDDNAGGFFATATDQVNTDPSLGPLKDNTGLTFTYAPLSNSPAIDRGKDTGADGNPTGRDQRNMARPQTYDLAITPPATGDRSDIGAVEAIPGPLPQSAVSRKVHGSAGIFDINLPLSGPIGVECRSGGVNNDFQVVATFASPVTIEDAAITSGTGSITSTTGSDSQTKTDGSVQGSTIITINLTGVVNAQRLNIGLFGVNDGVGKSDVGIQFGLLLGDTTGEGSVNSSDVGEAKMRSGETATSSNFRADVNANGVVNASDVSAVKLKSGTSLPAH